MAVDYELAALAAARRFCGWVVSPTETVTVTVDGSGGRTLSLPTLQLVDVLEVVEDGVTLDLAGLVVDRSRGLLRKKSGCWTTAFGGVEVTMTHGYAMADDFYAAVEQAAAALEASGTRTDSALKRKKVGEVEYEWFESASTFLNTSLLTPYRILPSP